MRALPLLLLALLPFTLGATAQPFGEMIHAVDEAGTYRFEPATATVAPGSRIVVMAVGQEPHALRAVDGSFDTGPLDPTDESKFSTEFLAPTTPGDYPFYCPYHADAATPTGDGMTGKLVVVAQSATPGGTPTMTPAATPKTTPAPALGALVALAGVALLLARRGVA